LVPEPGFEPKVEIQVGADKYTAIHAPPKEEKAVVENNGRNLSKLFGL
jgi:hypothetical protein